MKTSVDNNNSDIKTGDRIHGFSVKRVSQLKEINVFLYLLEHTDTGAQFVHISSSDEENTFSVAFKTVPSDSTGVAHILEHTALCGSKKFPVRDPFFSMLKRSLNTFMNAFTASDWTMYPFATQNKTDFYNLMAVYLDSTFYPNIDELSFKQEGHRLDIRQDSETVDVPQLIYKGVVYNEMKGAMSSPKQVMIRSILNALYPETTYSYNSGGDPAIIPTLTYEQLKAFHRRHYHPSNAFFFTYGNLPLRKHLSFIHNTVLKGFERINPDTHVPSHPRWSTPKKATYFYPLDKNEDPSKKHQVCSAWLTVDIKDAFGVLALTLLEQILLGNAASPLRKALIDSNLGSALCDGSGFGADARDTMFVCGLKDVEGSAADKIESIIFDVLENLSKTGIDKEMIESAIHQVEFHRKEVTNTPYPYGIKLLLAVAGSWFHGGDPERSLRFDTDLNLIRAALEEGPFFENLIKTSFLDNPHRVLLTLAPDPLMEQKENARVESELEQIRASMPPFEIEKIKTDAKLLTQRQERKEDVSCLPTLALTEIPPSVQRVAAAAFSNTLLDAYYQQPTSGIFYFLAVAGSGLVRKEQIPLVPFFCYAFSKIGTARCDYMKMAQRIDAYTGGLGLSCHARTGVDDIGACIPFVTVSGKCLVRNQEKLFEIMEELLGKFDFSDLVRLKSLLMQYRAGLESMVLQNGHRLAISLASRNFSTTGALKEAWHGIHQLKTIKKLTDTLTNDKLQFIAEELSVIGRTVLTPSNLKMALIGEEHSLLPASPLITSLRKELGHGSDPGLLDDGFGPPKIDLGREIPREGWSTSSTVSFVARTFETVRMEHEDAPVLSIISKIIKSMYLHREIREKGGAYGAFALYNPEDGLFCFSSYRDPHIVSTQKVYDAAQDFIRSGNYSNEDVNEAILQVCSEIDKPDPPGPAARKAFLRTIVSLSDEVRERFKRRLLKTTRQQVVRTAERYFSGHNERHAVAVISGEEKLNSANEKLAENSLTLYRI